MKSPYITFFNQICKFIIELFSDDGTLHANHLTPDYITAAQGSKKTPYILNVDYLGIEFCLFVSYSGLKLYERQGPCVNFAMCDVPNLHVDPLSFTTL